MLPCIFRGLPATSQIQPDPTRALTRTAAAPGKPPVGFLPLVSSRRGCLQSKAAVCFQFPHPPTEPQLRQGACPGELGFAGVMLDHGKPKPGCSLITERLPTLNTPLKHKKDTPRHLAAYLCTINATSQMFLMCCLSPSYSVELVQRL